MSKRGLGKGLGCTAMQPAHSRAKNNKSLTQSQAKSANDGELR